MISALFFTWFAAASIWTVNALRKPVPPGRPFPPLWLPAMIVSELAPAFFAVRFLIAAPLVLGGALDLAVGRVGLALFAFAQLGTIVLIRRSFQSARDFGASPNLLDLFRLRIEAPANIETTMDVPYADGLTMNLYRRDDATDAPALIYLHPGSWMRGRPGRQALPMLYELAEKGWVVMDIRYPLSPGATFPDHLIGVKRAIAWAKNQGSELGIDPTRVALAGASSGAHLASLAALTWDDPSYQPGFEDVDTSVIACAPHYGIFDLHVRNNTRYDWPFIPKVVMKQSRTNANELYTRASPLDQVRPDAPPFMIIHGDFDSIVLAKESQVFAKALNGEGVDVAYHEVPGAQHGYDAIPSIRTRAVCRRVAAFFIEVARTHDQSGQKPPTPRTH